GDHLHPKSLITFTEIRILLDEGYVSPSDLDLFTCVDKAEEIVSALERFYVTRAAGDGAT
ncbi:hypothetical protein ACSHSS_27795, partial [Burkholderia sp. BC1]